MRLELNRKKTFILAKREFLSRIKSKGYWLATLVLPAFMALVVFVPALIAGLNTSQLDVVLVDTTGRVAADLERRLEELRRREGARVADFRLETEGPAADAAAQREALDRRLLDEEIDAWIWIAGAALEAGEVEYRARNVSNVLSQEMLERQISATVRMVRLTEAGYDAEAVDELLDPVRLATVRVSAEGSRREGGEAGFLLAYFLFFLLYMMMLLWGNQVLQGVLEEKSSRVVEVIVSAARPFELMLGKLTGIGAAALVQFCLWMACLVALTLPGLVGALANLPEELQLPQVSLAQVTWVTLFFFLGFFVYSTMYAAVGAAFNNVQEAQQVAVVPTFAIIMPVFFLIPVINDPNGPLSTILSMVPILSPILMPLRIAAEMPPAWQLALSALILALFIWLMVWLCARIYRTGILMYGKKPTFKELLRWLRYA